jgi:hypothetical protein
MGLLKNDQNDSTIIGYWYLVEEWIGRRSPSYSRFELRPLIIYAVTRPNEAQSLRCFVQDTLILTTEVKNVRGDD